MEKQPADHLISIWPLTETGKFADSAPDYEGQPQPEPDARQQFEALDYASAAALTPYPADEWCPAYLICLDALDEAGDPVCVTHRQVCEPTPAGPPAIQEGGPASE